MEWAVVAFFAVIAASLVARAPAAGGGEAQAAAGLREVYARLLGELADLDDDAEAGRITAADRAEGRRALAPELRAVFARLRERGELTSAGASPGEGS